MTQQTSTMKTSSMNARNADLGSTDHKFPYKWNLADLEKVEKNGLKVFSCFSCGGGSTMGYKLAGFEVIGNCEIDPGIMKVYKENNKPKYSYLMDIRDFMSLEDIPGELYDLDILDGSPPCSAFSVIGKREDAWGVEKKFREGQEKQRLDDLFFTFIDVAEKLKPKVIIAENVEGLMQGNAKGYVNEIIKKFKQAGYKVQVFLLNAATMGVPQKRKRVFFIAHRNDLDFPRLKMNFNEPPIYFGEVRTVDGIEPKKGSMAEQCMLHRQPGDKYVSDITVRIFGKRTCYSNAIISDNQVACTLTGGHQYTFRMIDGKKLSDRDYANVQTFPQDYDFGNQSAEYICGMSVPPVMMAQIANQVYEQWLK